MEIEGMKPFVCISQIPEAYGFIFGSR